MQRRVFITMLAAAVASAAPAFAQSFRDAVIQQLTEQGFTKIVVSRTLLGRLRFVATNPTYRREIVINPNTGEVLRDYLVLQATGKPPGTIKIADPNRRGSGNGGSNGGAGNGGNGGGNGGNGNSGGNSGGGGSDDQEDDDQEDDDKGGGSDDKEDGDKGGGGDDKEDGDKEDGDKGGKSDDDEDDD